MLAAQYGEVMLDDLVKFFVVMFVVVDPPSLAPIFATLTEGASPELELFGEERFHAALRGGAALPLAALRDRVLARLGDHVAGAALGDDLTLLMLRRAP